MNTRGHAWARCRMQNAILPWIPQSPDSHLDTGSDTRRCGSNRTWQVDLPQVHRDAVITLFWIPVAHEGDPERAVPGFDVASRR